MQIHYNRDSKTGQEDINSEINKIIDKSCEITTLKSIEFQSFRTIVDLAR